MGSGSCEFGRTFFSSLFRSFLLLLALACCVALVDIQTFIELQQQQQQQLGLARLCRRNLCLWKKFHNWHCQSHRCQAAAAYIVSLQFTLRHRRRQRQCDRREKNSPSRWNKNCRLRQRQEQPLQPSTSVGRAGYVHTALSLSCPLARYHVVGCLPSLSSVKLTTQTKFAHHHPHHPDPLHSSLLRCALFANATLAALALAQRTIQFTIRQNRFPFTVSPRKKACMRLPSASRHQQQQHKHIRTCAKLTATQPKEPMVRLQNQDARQNCPHPVPIPFNSRQPASLTLMLADVSQRTRR